ncbi:hypothetical protein VB715_10180 [Crocosphaera sp. UHCC 0190]|uniref:hypothetical protein n=1 Tax=Crocosphaera sp. UHCC 0190 TaxID=3110246 RepID=UPI002B203087|nr:hypothetical protein [Crocosphaera sp. UHCC 0190]MEA5510128.1 hypothetical protein [Crocosphaera sp. UHCC 0190]
MVYSPQIKDPRQQQMDSTIVLDPILLRAAQRIYRTYCVLHSKQGKRPYGIAIHKKSHRGQLIFRAEPVLLPGECFVPTKQLEAEIY